MMRVKGSQIDLNFEWKMIGKVGCKNRRYSTYCHDVVHVIQVFLLLWNHFFCVIKKICDCFNWYMCVCIFHRIHFSWCVKILVCWNCKLDWIVFFWVWGHLMTYSEFASHKRNWFLMLFSWYSAVNFSLYHQWSFVVDRDSAVVPGWCQAIISMG